MLDAIWIGACCLLVLAQQLGFLCLEAGTCRSKNSINIATKNFIDIPLVFIFFVLIGHNLYAGSDFFGLIGLSWENILFTSSDPLLLANSLLLTSFCCTCVTITSGAAAERLMFIPYILLTLISAVIIFPLVAHWVWTADGWLNQLGAVDFAGSTVVHLVGGSIALATIIIIGARTGRFNADGSVNAIPKSNQILLILGGHILWWGWFGFNAGSLAALNNNTFEIILNTAVSGSAGALAIVAKQWISNKPFEADKIVNGSLSALVATTAMINHLSFFSCIVISVAGVASYQLVSKLMLKLRWDDAVDAVAVHLGAGATGSLLVAFTVADSSFFTQLLMVIVSLLFSFSLSYGFLKVIQLILPLRVSGEMEFIGLNVIEHNAKSDLHDLLSNMEYHRQTGDYATRIKADPFVEVGAITQQYNNTLDEIVAQKQLLTEALKAANQAGEAKSQFLANLSHEMRTPLNGVIGAAKLLSKKLDCPEKDKQFLQSIIISAERLNNNFDAIFEYCDLDNDKVSLKLTPINLSSLISEIEGKYRPIVESKGLSFSVNIENSIPETLYADQRGIKEILGQLLQNAINFTDAGEISLSITEIPEHSFSNQTRLMFAIKDSGIGIAKERLKEVFSPFNQVVSGDDRAVEGLGLGLSIVQKLVSLYRGQLEIDSHFGEYTIAYVLLDFPKQITTQQSNTLTKEQSTFLSESYPLEILIVDDNEINLTVVSTTLQQWGYQPDLANSGADALEKVAIRNYDLIFMDLQMPDMDGFETTNNIRSSKQLQNQPKIVALTASNTALYRKKTQQAGMDGFIAKPLEADKIQQHIEALFAK